MTGNLSRIVIPYMDDQQQGGDRTMIAREEDIKASHDDKEVVREVLKSSPEDSGHWGFWKMGQAEFWRQKAGNREVAFALALPESSRR